MDILKKSLAPITAEAWEQINDEANDIFTSVLSARKFVDVKGPLGINYGAVPTGRIDVPKNQKGKVKYGLNQVLPLVEGRTFFELNIWELDNASRGAEDIDLSSMEDAARELASFEENAIYYGLEKAGIKGIKKISDHKPVDFPSDTQELLNTLSTQIAVFKRNGIEGPYSLVVNEDDWERLSGQVDGYPLRKQINQLLKGSIILSPFINEAFLITERGGDFRLTVGQDISIGYNYHDKDTVELYFTESFTFQCFEPSAAIILKK